MLYNLEYDYKAGESMEQKKSLSMAHPFRLTFGEEVANSISHGVMALSLLGLLPYYAIRSYNMAGTRYAFGTSVFIICLFFMFLCSCLYHLQPYETNYKYVFRKLDHIMILLAIAGSYTPVCLTLVGGWKGIFILIVEWAMVVFGVLLKAISSQSHAKLSMLIYMVMGWMAVLILPTLIKNASLPFFVLILAGGILYSIGAVFYSHPEKRYFHFVWHLCIVAASICHMLAILYCMV